MIRVWQKPVLLLCLLLGASGFAANYRHGAMVREASIYVSPDPSSAKLGDVGAAAR